MDISRRDAKGKQRIDTHERGKLGTRVGARESASTTREEKLDSGSPDW
jgi:hypothetical protein